MAPRAPVLAPLLSVSLLLAACGSDGGGADAASVACPADPPAAGASCDAPVSCSWLRCATDGAVQASCDGSAWTVVTTACPVTCEGATCGADQLCRTLVGGALITDCVPDPCEGAELSSCACAVCPDPARCTIAGTTVRCDNCFSDVCP